MLVISNQGKIMIIDKDLALSDRVAVIDTFHILKYAIAHLKEALLIQDKDLPAWFLPPLELDHSNFSTRELVFQFINQLEYLDTQNPREILVGPGLIAASPETLERVKAVNVAKNNFKAAILKLKKQQIKINDPYLNEQLDSLLEKRSTDITKTLRKIGLSRLHLKQCYRSLPNFETRPLKVSWTWANTRSIKRITREDAIELLVKHNQDIGIQTQLEKVKALPPHTPLAIVQELAPHLRANLILPHNNEAKRLMIKGPVPIFYLHNGMDLPVFKVPGDKRGKDLSRPVRSDVKIDPQPFLPALRAHLYL
ncbi:MAG: replication terminus site-binding family protein [Francisellaceae bacterium]|nr:replication terminus site-binding family protein [Francisellaceae bacterium]